MAKKEDNPMAEYEKAAEALWNAEFLLVVAGPQFDEGGRSPFASEFCDPNLVRHPNKFMGYWGGFYNEYSDKIPHEGFNIISRWRDKFYCVDDMRKRQNKKKGPEDETELDRIPRCFIFTPMINGLFQKAGFPVEDIYEACGSINLWQCSTIPPCCNRVTQIDRNFRFVIEEATQEAQPIKYVPDQRERKHVPKFEVIDSDDEELAAMEGHILGLTNANAAAAAAAAGGGTVGTTSTGIKIKDNRRYGGNRQVKAQVVRLSPALQVGAHRFPDLFCGFAATNKEGLCTDTFADAPEDPMALKIGAFSLNEEPKQPSKQQQQQSAAVPFNVPAEVRVRPPVRCSHLLAHIDMLDRGVHAERMGVMYACDPDRWLKERELYYQSIVKIFVADSHHVALKRNKYVSYNISIIFVSDDDTATESSSSSRKRRGFNTDEDSYKRSVLDPEVLKQLYAVYPENAQVPVLDRETGEPTGEYTPVEESVMRRFDEVHLRKWKQGKWSWFYFSNVKGRQTMQEPLHSKFHDVVHIPLPLDEDGKALYEIPPKARVSIVCETVIDQQAAAEAGEPIPKYDAGSGNNPFLYTRNVWQMGGTLPENAISVYAASEAAVAASVAQPKKAGAASIGSSGATTSGGFAGQYGAGSILPPLMEYILETRKRHVLKVGVAPDRPHAVNYVQIEVPCDETDPEAAPTFVSHVKRSLVKDDPALHSEGFSFIGTFKKEEKVKPPVPTPNHQLCVHCHDIARPFVLMSRSGVKDEGFCQGYLATRTKAFKAWEKMMTDALKSDQSKSLVLLEVGCEKKMDVSRAYSEKTYKMLKNSRCTLVRISPYNLETKKKNPGGGRVDVSSKATLDAIAFLACFGSCLSLLLSERTCETEKSYKNGEERTGERRSFNQKRYRLLPTSLLLPLLYVGKVVLHSIERRNALANLARFRPRHEVLHVPRHKKRRVLDLSHTSAHVPVLNEVTRDLAVWCHLELYEDGGKPTLAEGFDAELVDLLQPPQLVNQPHVVHLLCELLRDLDTDLRLRREVAQLSH